MSSLKISTLKRHDTSFGLTLLPSLLLGLNSTAWCLVQLDGNSLLSRVVDRVSIELCAGRGSDALRNDKNTKCEVSGPITYAECYAKFKCESRK